MGWGRKMLILLLALAGLGALTGLSALTAVCVCERMEYVPVPSDCILVLGAHVWADGRLSNALEYRCQAALEAWRSGLAPVLIVCGGQGQGEPEPEAEAMYRWMLERGVPEDRLIAENQSRNTRENLQNAREIMRERGFQTCAICTSSYHLRRALWQARDEGLNACGISAPSTKDIVSFVRGRFRETCSWILYFLRRI